jgi:diguanylate cyclase (GGDEF)-like protein/PAS domain S-box-containing protein
MSEHSKSSSALRYGSLDDADTLRMLFRNLAEAIYISDEKGRILDANPAFLEVFGVDSIDALQRYNVTDLLADPERRKLELAMLARDGAVREFELDIIRPDGQRRTVLDTTYLVRDPESGTPYYHGILVDITKRKELETTLHHQLVRDALTGCYNRRFLRDFDDRAAGGEESRWGCLYVDIDHFKQYNDQYGHQKGDEVLVRMARFLMRQVRASEPVIRLGGDEFLVLLLGENAASTEEIAQRLQKGAARSAPVAFSLGWAVRERNESLEDTMHRADRTLLEVRVLSRTGDWPTLPDEMERRTPPPQSA